MQAIVRQQLQCGVCGCMLQYEHVDGNPAATEFLRHVRYPICPNSEKRFKLPTQELEEMPA